MIEKPHRFLLDRVSSYGEEGRAFLRRRRMRSRPFARVRYEGGEEVALDPSTGRGSALSAAAAALIEGDAGRV
ncbi:MAG: hypothetical protein EDQ89_11135 [Acidobacteria bacterium]|nr:MAG: hypothetical protein EDQ89_11135 [Acidobacteriota bacterium]GIK77028.1 MAG: hypothetical protein BroJett022_07180 [Actinomycetes bacterium]